MIRLSTWLALRFTPLMAHEVDEGRRWECHQERHTGWNPGCRRSIRMGQIISMKTMTFGASAVVMCFAASLFAIRAHAAADASTSWNPRAAAAYLDQRQGWWMTWPTAARDHDTFCVSCHTAVPYALARPALRAALGETGPSADEMKLLDNVTKRVRLWKEVAPFYPWRISAGRMVLGWVADYAAVLTAPSSRPTKASQSRGTEAILNALILASRDARTGTLSDDARHAFDNLWSLQLKTGELAGAWPWLNLRNEPWESAGSPYFGAALAAVAVGTAPNDYLSRPDIQEGLKLLRAYLKRGDRTEHLFNRVMLLWASTKMPGLLGPDRQQAIIAAVLSKQQDDGGWSLSSLAPWKRIDGTPLNPKSDGYATGLITLVLQAAGVSRVQPKLKRALSWLVQHQDRSSGAWSASSLNLERDAASNVGRFMNDAATAFAVLALSKNQ
jgi:squalene-hopene/tetraprenyl-beta-curcumene cyclase